MYAIIFAGGSGTRLWPVSRKSQPKQIKPFLDDKTLLQKTYERVSRFISPERIFISTLADYAPAIKEQIPISENQLILAPIKTDTASAMGLAAIKIHHQDPSAVITNVWADHYIRDEDAYGKVINVCESLISKHPETIICAGVNPTYPETGYGYIKMGECVGEENDHDVFMVESFIEKPDLERAKEYVSRWEYLWNPAFFFMKADYLLDLYRQYQPRMYQSMEQGARAIGTAEEKEVFDRAYMTMQKISFDRAIIEKAPRMLVVPVDMGWADVGHWKAIKDIAIQGKENAVKGLHVSIDSKNNLLYSYSNKLISTIGIENTIVIETEDAILICKDDRAQEVKEIVRILEDKELSQYL